jgi:glucosamine-6-phosphate deaminase
MKVIRVKDQAEGSKKAFELIKKGMENGVKVLGLATGSTPEGLYKEMVASDLDFSEMTSINLDEYVGLDGTSDQSYRYFMNHHLFDAKPFKTTFVPDGVASDLEKAAAEYEAIVDANPIDIQILGIGHNGHIGFNEPGTAVDSLTSVVDLTQSTINANSIYFDKKEDVPTKAVSMGIASILKSKEIILMAWGAGKADAIKGMINDEASVDCPASLLRNHDNVIVIVDEEAASKL